MTMRGWVRRVAIGLTTAVLAAAPAAAEIRWETKLPRAVAAARASNRAILIEFWSATCEPCQEMDRDVYTDERVASAMAKLHPVRIDLDRDPETARTYDVGGAPTIVLTDSTGRELFRYAGALPLDRMLQLLDALPADVSRINALSTALAARKDDFAALTGLAGELRAAGFYRSSSEYYGRALKTREGRRAGADRLAILMAMARNALELRLYVDAEKLCAQALRDASGRPEAREIRLDLARALAGQGRTAEAQRLRDGG